MWERFANVFISLHLFYYSWILYLFKMITNTNSLLDEVYKIHWSFPRRRRWIFQPTSRSPYWWLSSQRRTSKIYGQGFFSPPYYLFYFHFLFFALSLLRVLTHPVHFALFLFFYLFVYSCSYFFILSLDCFCNYLFIFIFIVFVDNNNNSFFLFFRQRVSKPVIMIPIKLVRIMSATNYYKKWAGPKALA